MANFSFSARDAVGQPQLGTLEAPSASAVAGILRERGWFVLKIEEAEAEVSVASNATMVALNRPRGISVELALRQLAVMLKAGISLLSAMETIAEQSTSRPIRRIFGELIEHVQEGGTLSEAMSQHAAFPEFIISLVKVGEQTGIQESVLVRGADMMRTRRETLRDVMTAVSYPAIVLCLAGAVTVYIVTALVPKLTTMLQSFGKPLPPMTQSLVTITDFFKVYGPSMAVVAGASLVAFIVTYSSPLGRLAIDRVFLQLPVFGRILRLSGTMTFAQSMGALIRSGVTVVEALVTVQQMHGNKYLARCVQNARESTLRGNELAESLRVPFTYMPLLATMTAVGEQSGNLDEVMEEVAEFHQSQLKALIKSLSAWVTPALIMSVGTVVGYVYIAFFVGIFAVAR